MSKPLDKSQLEVLEKILPTLNHYQLLKINPSASPHEVQEAFHKEALLFHPDRYQKLNNGELLELSRKIYFKVVEAYRTLSHRAKRKDYDLKLNLKVLSHEIDDEESRSEVTTFQTKKTASPTNGPGFKFFKMAQSSFQSGNLNAARMNIQLALNMEQQNSDYAQLMQRIDLQIKKSKA